jgi:rhodanese-related sulfurtransferase
MELNIEEFRTKQENRKKHEGSFFLLDVRNPMEQDICKIPETDMLIPIKDLPFCLDQLQDYKETEIIVYCKVGVRSRTACDILTKAGFQNVKNLSGGILEYIDQVDPSLPVY